MRKLGALEVKKAAELHELCPEHQSVAVRILVDGVLLQQLIPLTDPAGWVLQQKLVQIYQSLVPPHRAGECSLDLYQRVIRRYTKGLKPWTEGALKMVMVDGYRQSEVALLFGLPKQQITNSLRVFRARAIKQLTHIQSEDYVFVGAWVPVSVADMARKYLAQWERKDDMDEVDY